MDKEFKHPFDESVVGIGADVNIEESSDEVFTIPNVISFFRIILIPFFMYFYLTKHYWVAVILLVISALSDIIDGIIARKFHMISNLGKALDPIADKLTQISVMLCLVFFIPNMVWPLGLIVVKELTTGIFGLITLRKTGLVKGARWYGKLTTVLLYVMMGLHIVWPLLHRSFPDWIPDATFPPLASQISIAVCCAMMLVAGVLYVTRYIKLIRLNKKKSGADCESTSSEVGKE